MFYHSSDLDKVINSFKNTEDFVILFTTLGYDTQNKVSKENLMYVHVVT